MVDCTCIVGGAAGDQQVCLAQAGYGLGVQGVPGDDRRLCVSALKSPHGLRTIVPVGSMLPLDRGSAGRVLRGDAEALERGWAESVEERQRGVASVSAPIYEGGRMVAAVSVSGPIERTTREPGRRYAAQVVAAASEIAQALGN